MAAATAGTLVLVSPAPGATRAPGRVGAILLSPEPGAPMREASWVRALAGRGLEGDRYSTAPGALGRHPERAGTVTLIEAEVLEAIHGELGIVLAPAEARRNLVVRGVRLGDLVGRPFRVGSATLRGVGLCQPCRRIEEATRPGVLRALAHCGGLRAVVVLGGEIGTGDPIEEVP
jgi:MOSC domain-containing protein YiiM